MYQRIGEWYDAMHAFYACARDHCSSVPCLTAKEQSFVKVIPREPALHDLLLKTMVDRESEQTFDGWDFLGHTGNDGLRNERAIRLYKKGLHCWIIFSGIARDRSRVLLNFTKGFSGKICGIKNIYGPLIADLLPLLATEKWKNMASNLTQCNKVTVSGLSWGAALADLFTACASNGRLHDLYSSDIPEITVNQLYSVGGFVGTWAPLRNASDAAGCFTGGSFFFPNDPIARYLPDAFGLRKPLMDVVRFGIKEKEMHFYSRTCKDKEKFHFMMPHDNPNISALSHLKMLHVNAKRGLMEATELAADFFDTCFSKPRCKA